MRTPRLRRLLSCSLALVVAAAGARADVLVVGPGGSFTDLQAAVDAAVDGDVVLVKGGTYNSVIVLGKAVTITAEAGFSVLVEDVTVQLLSSERTVVLSGLTIDSNSGGVPGLQLLENEGAVRVADCTINGLVTLIGTPSEGVVVDLCDDVSFVDCAVTGGRALFTTFGAAQAGGVGMSVTDSTVAVHGGTVTGGEGGAHTVAPNPGGPGGVGLLVDEATVLVSGATVSGGRGGGGAGCDEILFVSGDGGPGGTGVELLGNAFTTAFRVQDSAVSGGPGGFGGSPSPFGCTDTGDLGADGQAYDDPLGLTSPVPGTAHALTALSPVREFQPLDLDLVGDPGDLAAVLGAALPGTSWQPGANGQLLVGVPFQVRIVGTVPASGLLELTTAFPDLGPGVEHVTLFTQPLFLGTGGALTLGAPHTAVVLDSGF